MNYICCDCKKEILGTEAYKTGSVEKDPLGQDIVCDMCLGKRQARASLDKHVFTILPKDVKPVMKDSGERQQFEGGAQRDTAAGKLPYSLLGPHAWTTLPYGVHVKHFLIEQDPQCLDDMLVEMLGDFGHDTLIAWLERGAKKYSRFNWAKGMPISRVLDSLGRHLEAHLQGKTDESHPGAAMCNVMFLHHYVVEMEEGRLDPKWNDLFDFNLYKPEKPNEPQ